MRRRIKKDTNAQKNQNDPSIKLKLINESPSMKLCLLLFVPRRGLSHK